MKYIDTKTQASLKHGVMDFLNLTECEMEQIFESIYYDTEKEPWEWVQDFLTNYISDEKLEYLQMFHLSRRLDGTDIKINNNLQKLLIEETPISKFFKKYNITFKKGDNHIDIFWDNKLQVLNEEYGNDSGNVYYLRWRLGYNEEQDYCVNGFAFRSYLEKNDYFRTLSRCPELVDNIERIMNIYGMSEDYYNNSKYYCIEYLIPIKEIIFDINNPPNTEVDKTFEFVKYAILRLYDSWRESSFVCDENLILRLADDANIKEEWFINAEEIVTIG